MNFTLWEMMTASNKQTKHSNTLFVAGRHSQSHHQQTRGCYTLAHGNVLNFHYRLCGNGVSWASQPTVSWRNHPKYSNSICCKLWWNSPRSAEIGPYIICIHTAAIHFHVPLTICRWPTSVAIKTTLSRVWYLPYYGNVQKAIMVHR